MNKELLKNRISNVIKTTRQSYGISQIELSRVLRMAQPHLSLIEQGAVMPNLNTWYTFCEHFNMSSKMPFEDASYMAWLEGNNLVGSEYETK